MAYWGWAWGLIGVVLALPIATCIRAGLAAVDSTRPIAGLMSED
jgi:predicted PurR-regulated permease PerM